MSRVTPCGKRPREISLWEMPLRAPVGDTSWAGEMSDFHTSGGNVYVVSAQLYLIVSLCDPMDCVARQAPLCLGFFREEHWSGLPFPSPGDLPNPGLEPTSIMNPALAGRLFTTAPPGNPNNHLYTPRLYPTQHLMCPQTAHATSS